MLGPVNHRKSRVVAIELSGVSEDQLRAALVEGLVAGGAPEASALQNSETAPVRPKSTSSIDVGLSMPWLLTMPDSGTAA